MPELRLVDSHCHLYDEKYDQDRAQVLKRAHEAGLAYLVVIGCDSHTSEQACALAQSTPNAYFSAGFHPHEAKFFSEQHLENIKKIAQDPKCVAIGECGLDFYYEHSNKEEQIKAFIEQIKLSQELDLALVIHLRDAHETCVSILKEHLKPGQKFIIHCFSGTLEQAHEFVSMGALISLSGIVTFKKPGALIEVAKSLKLENLLIETDSPYLAPHPHRGERNEPAFLNLTLQAIAKARGQDEKVIAEQIYRNSLEIFKIIK